MRERLRLTLVTAVLAAALSLGALAQTQSSSERTLKLSFPADGVVTLEAKNVTIREILAEWSRQTGAVFANAEKLPSQPQTLLFEQMPQSAVIDSLLRDAAGYLLAPQGGGPVATSNVASVYIIPTSRATSTGAFTSPAPAAFAPQVVTQGNPNDEIPPVTPATEEPPQPTSRPQPNQPTYLGNPGGIGGIVPITPVPSRGSGSGTTGRGGTPPPPPPPPTGGGAGS